ncbi:flavin reductase family protein [Frankia sp. QA3]|uniref:flavin reductase family protein n=1 Tax=Frankia sp. QA3 TaxID=710111 RepID=UPI000269BF0D|nr:flavin reductase family protein [Frankia sp. QA3]EIV92729.1 DIM6/NTAB family protein [Frankia sp. QA3]
MTDDSPVMELLVEQAVTPASMRSVSSRFATGVIVLTVGGDHVHGMTANAFSSVSLEPPTVLCCIAQSAVMHRALTTERRFGVSILASGQRDQAAFFADKFRPLGPTQFDGVDWQAGPRTGVPLLLGAVAWLECEVVDMHAACDHTVFLGSVESLSRGSTDDALLYFGGGYRRIAA